MADVTAAHPHAERSRRSFRPDRVYLGWQYVLLAPDPGPPPRRPTPPDQEQLNPDWVAAQRREESLLDRPLKVACAVSLVFAAVLLALWITGVLSGLLATLGLLICLVVAAISGYAVWQGEQALRSRVSEERLRLGKIRADQERRLFGWQEEHKRRFEEWQQRRAAFDRQLQWYAVSLPDAVDRVDVAGGTLAGWSALATMIGATRLSAGGEVTFIDLSEGAAAAELVSVAQRSGIDPLVWVLPGDLPRLDIGTGLGKEGLADVLSLVVSVMEEHGTTRDLSYDNAILERVLDVFGGRATIAEITAALRALAQVGDPRDDMRRGLLDADQLARLAAMFGRGAADRVVIERAWAMESQLRKLESLGTAPERLAPARLRVLSTDRRAGVFGNRVLGTFAVTALTHMLRQAPAGHAWQHTVCLLGAEKLRGDVLDRLCDACESTRTGLVIAYRSVPAHVRERLGRGNAAVAFMRLGNAEDASAASEQIGTEQRFVLSQLTETIGTEVTDSIGDSYTSTVGTSDGISTSVSATSTEGRSRGRGASHESVLMPFGRSTRSRSMDASYSYATGDSEMISSGITTSTAWGLTTSRALGASQSVARSSQRSREFLVEQHELQQLPPSAVIITHAAADGRRVVLADANPAIHGLATATLLSLEDLATSREAAHAEAVRAEAAHAGQSRGETHAGAAGGGAHAGAPNAGAPRAGKHGGAPRGPAPAGTRGPVPGGTRGPAPGGQDPPGAGQVPPAAAAGWPLWPESRPATTAGAGPSGPYRDRPVSYTGPHAPAGAASPPGSPAGDPEANSRAPGTQPPESRERKRRKPKPVSWQGEDQPPPNLGPPPARLDWRRKRRDGS